MFDSGENYVQNYDLNYNGIKNSVKPKRNVK